MRPALLTRKIGYPRRWEELPNGEVLRGMVEEQLEDITRQIFGYHLARIGDLSGDIKLPQSPIKHVVNLSDAASQNAGIIGQPSELPLLDNSVDAVLLAHELDFARNPHQILREVNRVIMPSGHVIIVGFNPFSTTGLMRFLPIRRKQVLREARFFSAMRIKDWLHLLGFDVVAQYQLVYTDLFLGRTIRPNGRWQRWCNKYLPWASAMYIIVAKKGVMPITVVKPEWKPKPNFSAVGASMRLVKKVSSKSA